MRESDRGIRHRAVIALAVFLVFGVLAATDPSAAQEPGAAPPPFPEFTFRRVPAPAPGAPARITVQIAPGAEEAAILPAPAEGGLPPALPEGWFWETISPSLDAAGPGRWLAALTHLEGAPQAQGLPAPPLGTMRAVADRHGRDILLATLGTRVSPALVLAVIAVESGGRASAVSSRGAEGIMQLIPATAERFGVEDPMDAAQNIRGGVAYLDWLLEAFGGDPILALAGYNAGEGAVRRAEGVPAFPETRTYVPRVLAAWRVARLLCATPPELFSDGCVFAVTEAAR
ncbi:MAG: lytic transglycosylase domain-containing protein [Rhodobacteraceae bacterium]|nr:lytic transglycosylase domain-containing protein [Paracoccaceae bacterium]